MRAELASYEASFSSTADRRYSEQVCSYPTRAYCSDDQPEPLHVSGIMNFSTYSITSIVRSQEKLSHYKDVQLLAEKIVNTRDTTQAEPEHLRAPTDLASYL